jgi:2-polyprenyl-3-methyl-5-hydroxy-6-metoxy-1,4-benzoquinol methylase
VTQNEVARRLASLYPMRSLRGYVRWKVRSDPAYPAVAEHLRGYEQPLLDLGCGVGLLPFFLRERGYAAPILGVDFDERKIEVARKAAQRYRGVDFIAADVRMPLPENHNVVMLDILHYLQTADQQAILRNAAGVVPPGGVAIVRQAVRDGSWRYRLTETVDTLARTMHWMRAEAINFPTPEEIAAPFEGFEITKHPLWGRMPYNNYLFVFRRR